MINIGKCVHAIMVNIKIQNIMYLLVKYLKICIYSKYIREFVKMNSFYFIQVVMKRAHF